MAITAIEKRVAAMMMRKIGKKTVSLRSLYRVFFFSRVRSGAPRATGLLCG